MKRFNTRLFRRLLPVVGAVTLAATVLAMGASAAAPPAPNANGFENASDVATYPGTDANAMFDVTRVPSDPAGITASSGGYFAQAATNVYGGPLTQFHRFGGYSSTFPAGGYTTSIDVYLDMSQATGSNDLRFDWSSAINNSSGAHLRDFIFSVGTDPTTAGQFKMSASNNAPGNPSASNAFTISASGWYTLKHNFHNDGAGVLAVEMSVLKDGTALHTWNLSTPTDAIGSTVGGNRYGWLVYNTFPSLALDNVTRSGVVAAPTCKTVKTSLGLDLTAAVVNPGIDYAGPLPLSGCAIGVYFDQAGSVKSADIAGATHYGVFADKGATVDVTGSQIHQIGNSPFSGNQNGRAVFYANGATGTVSGNQIYDYQKNGVVLTGYKTAVQVLNNTVTGRGHISTITQNGVVVLDKATGLIKGNSISHNWYTGTGWTAYGLLIIDAKGVKQQANSFLDNQVNLGNFGRGGGNTNA